MARVMCTCPLKTLQIPDIIQCHPRGSPNPGTEAGGRGRTRAPGAHSWYQMPVLPSCSPRLNPYFFHPAPRSPTTIQAFVLLSLITTIRQLRTLLGQELRLKNRRFWRSRKAQRGVVREGGGKGGRAAATCDAGLRSDSQSDQLSLSFVGSLVTLSPACSRLSWNLRNSSV